MGQVDNPPVVHAQPELGPALQTLHVAMSTVGVGATTSIFRMTNSRRSRGILASTLLASLLNSIKCMHEC